jgi:hypothetical protein
MAFGRKDTGTSDRANGQRMEGIARKIGTLITYKISEIVTNFISRPSLNLTLATSSCGFLVNPKATITSI